MPMDRFIIAPFKTGLETDVKSWLIPDDAMARLNNAYVFRGRIRKRFGGRLTGTGFTSSVTQPLFSRVRIQVGTIGAPASPVPGAVFQVGQMISAGDQIFTVITAGVAQPMLATGVGTGTFSTTNGAFALAGTGLAAGTPIYFYPGQPIMGLTQYQTGPINQQPSYAFDTQFAYLFSGGAWNRSGTAIWHGSDINFFWSTTWRGTNAGNPALFTTNFFAVAPNGIGNANDDPIWWTSDGVNWTAAVGNNAFYFLPAPGDPAVPQARYTGPYVKTARIIMPYKQNRLLLFNTIENDNPNGNGTLGQNTSYVNRCRYTHNGNPFAQNAWYEFNQSDSSNTGTDGQLSRADGGGFVDAPTTEAIISAQYIKDRVIVFFERSTWELVSSNNALQPFFWQKINTELGSEGQQSSVPFDKVILTVGNVGVHSCNGANVERIDDKIPDQVFEIQDKNAGVQRVAGIRDYFTEMVYWTYPGDNQRSDQPFPQRVLVYNYKNESWALNDDCITAFGYFNSQDALTWAAATDTWQETTQTWASGTLGAQFRQVIAGNQQGYIFIVDAESTDNARVMQITNMSYNAGTQALTLTIVNHMLRVNDFIEIKDAQGVTIGGFGIYQVSSIVNANAVILNNITVFSGTYTGGGTVKRVSRIDILSKQWNPYDKTGRNVYVAKIDFAVFKTSAGQVSIDYSPSSTALSMVNDGIATNSIVGTSELETHPYALYPLEEYQTKLWHPVYFQTDGECIQIRIYLNNAQMVIPEIVYSPFEIQGMVLHTMPTRDRFE